MSVAHDARDLQRRLGFAYMSVFAIVLVVFVAAVHVAFALDFRHEESARLDALQTQAEAAYDTGNGKPRIDVDGVQLADPHLEGVLWYDAAGELRAQAGTVPDAGAPPRPGVERHTSAVWSRDAQTPYGSLRTAIVPTRDAASLARDDVGLGIGLLVALIAAGFGGRYLAARAIARIITTMRTLRDFTADAAHELRGPLAALRGNADAALRDDQPLSPAHRRRLQTIDATARDMTRTVDDLLVIARAEQPLERSLFAIDLNERIARTVDARRGAAAAKGVGLTTSARDRARIYGDPSEVDRILGNLVDNAVRFTPDVGNVDVSCSPESGGFCVRVTDTGIGIASPDLPKIFERFWRSDPVRGADGGSGLGLAIVRALVRRHGGDVSARSTLGQGSEFTVWLPSHPPRNVSV